MNPSSRCAFLSLAICLLFCPMAMGAVVDDLEDIGADDTAVTSRVIDGVTVTITVSGGLQLLARTYNSTPAAFTGAGGGDNAPANPGNVSLTRFISTDGPGSGDNFVAAEPITFELDQPVLEFGLTTLDLLENLAGGGDFVQLEAFDGAGGSLDVHIRTGPQGPSGLDLDWFVAGPDIVKVVLSGAVNANSAGYGIDDLLLTATPVPTQDASWSTLKARW